MDFDRKKNIFKQINRERVFQGLAALLPLVAYVLWRNSPLGDGWAELQDFYFGRGLMSIERSLANWSQVFFYARYQSQGEGLVYFWIEVFAIAVALLASLWLVRKDPQVGLFSLAIIALSVFSGSAQSMARYMLIVPANYIFLGYLGRHQAFGRSWTLASLLLMEMSVMLFSFDLWTG